MNTIVLHRSRPSIGHGYAGMGRDQSKIPSVAKSERGRIQVMRKAWLHKQNKQWQQKMSTKKVMGLQSPEDLNPSGFESVCLSCGTKTTVRANAIRTALFIQHQAKDLMLAPKGLFSMAEFE